MISVDVLIVGGGSAGCFAALGAKAHGLRVMIIEPHNVLGGQGTAGGVAGFCGDTHRVNQPFHDVCALLEKDGLIAPLDEEADRRPYDLESFAFHLQEFVIARGVEVFFHARVVDVVCKAKRVREATVAAGGQLYRIRAKVVIDATGECVVPHKAGFKTFHEGAHKQLPMSLYFTLWDGRKKVKPVLPKGCPRWRGDKQLPMTTLHEFPSGKIEVKMKVIGFDAADPLSLSEAEVEGRRAMMGLIYHLQTKGYRGKVYDHHVLASVSRQIGVREGRRIVGEHVLSLDQVMNGAQFPDAVSVGTYHLDYHWPDKVERAGTGITTYVPPYHIPLRSLIPNGAKNILVPGRGASGDQMAMSSYRVMATCIQMGFAAGIVARTCIRDGVDVGKVDIKKVQRTLRRNGQSVKLSEYGAYQARHRAAQAKGVHIKPPGSEEN
jgi:hypothetical protein